MKSCDFLELSEQDPQEFSDMGSDHWAYAAAVRLKDVGFIINYEDGSYQQGKKLTRAELAVVLDRLRTTLLEEVN